MNKRFSYWLCLAVLLTFTSCTKDEREDNQRKQIENYIKNTLKKEVDEQNGVYLVLLATDSSGAIPVWINKNDRVEFEYQAWTLGGSVFATSDDSIAIKSGLVPLRMGAVKVGVGQLIKGLDIGLQRMALGDYGIILFPFTLGYGSEQYVGNVPPESALIFEVFITKVNNHSYP